MRRGCTPISVFRGGFESAAAEEVSGLDDSFELLDSLVAHSLVTAEPQGDTVRYSMLETIREHGDEMLHREGRTEEVHEAHLAWIASLVREGARYLETEQSNVWAARFRRETANLRAALAYAAEHDPITGAAICGGLSRYWFAYATEVDVTGMESATSFLDEGRSWSQMMLDADIELPPKIRARLLTALGGLLLVRLGRLEEGVAKVREAAQIWEQLGDRRNLGWALFYEGIASWSREAIEETWALFNWSTELHLEAEDAFGSLVSRMMRGLASAVDGDLDRARPDLSVIISTTGESVSPWVRGHGNDTRALLAVLEGDFDSEARDGLRAALIEFRSVPNYACLCHAMQTAGMYMASQGELEDAACALGVVQSIRDRLGMVIPPYEDRTFWIDDLGLAHLDRERRAEMEELGRAMRPEDGIEWAIAKVAET